MWRTAVFVVPFVLTCGLTAASAACLDTEMLVQGKCLSRGLSHFSVGTLRMSGDPTSGDKPTPLPAPTYNVGTIEMTGIGGPPAYNVGTILMTGIAP